MKGFTEEFSSANICAWKCGVAFALTTSLVACGGGGGGESADSSAIVTPQKSETPIVNSTAYTQAVQGRANLPSGVTGDGENLFLDDIHAARGDDNDTPFNAFGLNSTATVVGAVDASEADRRDFFLVDLTKNQWLTLQPTEATASNADVFLYDLNMNLITAGMGPSALESLQVPSTATYYIEVAHVAEQSADLVKYRLDLLANGQQPVGDLLSAASFSLNDHIIPGQLIVTMKDHAGVVTPKQLSVNVTNATTVKSASAIPSVNSLFLDAASVLTSDDSDTAERRSAITNEHTRQAFDTLIQARLLEQFDEVVSAEPDQILYATALESVNDNQSSQQWGMELIDVEGAWPVSEGDGVTVAVLDSAFLTDHPDFEGRMKDEYDFVEQDQNVDASSTSSLQHGTHVAGIIAAATNNNAHIAGVASNANVMPLRVLDDCLCGSLGSIIQGLRYSAGLPNSSGTVPTVTAKIANLSIDLPYGRNVALIQTLEDVTAAGTTVVWASGNDAQRHSYDESGVSGVPGVVIVNAVGNYQKLASYSNYGSAVDLTAPGGDNDTNNGSQRITSLSGVWKNNGWMYNTTRLQGSSQAAPFVSGVLALMASVWADMTPAAVDALIEAGELTRDMGVPGNDDYFGAGVIDAARAMQTALQQVGADTSELAPKRVVASPGEASFGAAINDIEVDVFSTDENAARLSISYAPAWVTVTELQTDNGYGTWQISLNRDALSTQNNQGVIHFSNGDRVLAMPVSAHNAEQSGRSTGVANMLMQFIDVNTQAVVHEEYATPEANHRFVLASDSVPAGRYNVQASSDFDLDEQFCEAGEICGYLNDDRNAVLTIVAGQDIQFEVPLQLQ